MVSELLRLRFKDKDCRKKLQLADTNLKRALAWQHIGSVLSQSMGVVVRGDQASQKYRKLKCEYQKEKRELLQTGNSQRQSQMDEMLWSVLNDAFSTAAGTSGDILVDTELDGDAEGPDDENGDDPAPSPQSTTTTTPQKAPPIVQLASALQSGMEAIAASLGNRGSVDNGVQSLAAILQQQHEETRQLQQLQIQLLRQLVSKENDTEQ